METLDGDARVGIVRLEADDEPEHRCQTCDLDATVAAANELVRRLGSLIAQAEGAVYALSGVAPKPAPTDQNPDVFGLDATSRRQRQLSVMYRRLYRDFLADIKSSMEDTAEDGGSGEVLFDRQPETRSAKAAAYRKPPAEPDEWARHELADYRAQKDA